MKDAFLVLQHFFNWRFFLILFCITGFGLTLPDRWIKPFRSVRFNIYLFLVIALASSIGTFISPDKYNVYHTWWFAGLLALMAFDVIACKLRRLPMLVQGPTSSRHEVESIEHFFSQSRHKSQVSSEYKAEETIERVRDWLNRHHLSFKEEDQKIKGKPSLSSVALFAARHQLQRWGDFILHVSIVAVLAGNLMGAMFGFEEVLPIPQGSSVRMKNRPYDVALNDFKIEYYQGSGAPSLYASDLVVREKGQLVAQKRIVVNDPLDINRVRFYQASWGMTYDFHTATLHVAGKDIQLRQKEIVRIPGTPLSVRANEFLPSFDIGPDGRATNTDFEGKNPALQVDFLSGGNVQARVWLLKNDPDTAFRIVGDKPLPAAPPPFHFVDVNPIFFSGIQVGYDPGAPLFWTGAIVLLVGLCMHFYMHQRRLRILIVPRGSKTDVIIGGWNSRTIEDFQEEFSRWVAEIKAAVS